MRLSSMVLGLLCALASAPGHAGDNWREPHTDMEFVALPKGCFQMGLPADAFKEEGGGFRQRLKVEMPQHEVCVDAFWLGRHEVRQADWQKVMGITHGAAAADTPVAGVSWEAANDFARRLTELSGSTAHFRLPTEAEWEYACRAAAKAATGQAVGKDVLDSLAWYSSPYQGFSGIRMPGVQPVGQKTPNAYGLYDMLGNVWEWVQDAYQPDAYARHSLYNPVQDAAGERRVIRGGGLRSDARMTRCETRAWQAAQQTHDTVGLRLVRDR